jgi:hypothetical protein
MLGLGPSVLATAQQRASPLSHQPRVDATRRVAERVQWLIGVAFEFGTPSGVGDGRRLAALPTGG